jgi:ribonuclease T2
MLLPNGCPTSRRGMRHIPVCVHGLWPQYATGFPEFCRQPAPQLDCAVISSTLGLMPAPRLIFNEWERHEHLLGPKPACLL